MLDKYLPQFTLMDFTHFDLILSQRFVFPESELIQLEKAQITELRIPPRQPQQLYYKYTQQDESRRSCNFVS